MKNHKSTMVLIFILLLLSVVSLFIGVLDVSPHGLLSGDNKNIFYFETAKTTGNSLYRNRNECCRVDYATALYE